MAFTERPYFRIVTGGVGLTANDTKTEFTLGEKLEYNINITDQASATVPVSGIGPVKFISFESVSAFTVTISTAGDPLVFGVDKVFLFTPTANFMAGVTGVEVSTASTTAQEVRVKVIGTVVTA